MHTYTHTYTHTYIHTYIHTHIHMHTTHTFSSLTPPPQHISSRGGGFLHLHSCSLQSHVIAVRVQNPIISSLRVWDIFKPAWTDNTILTFWQYVHLLRTTNTTNTIPSSYTIKLYLLYEVLVWVLWMRFCHCHLSSQKYATELLLDLQVVVGEWQVINSFFFQDKDVVWRETIIVRYNYEPMVSGAQWKSRLRPLWHTYTQ